MTAVFSSTDPLTELRTRVLVDRGVDRGDGPKVWIGIERTVGRSKALQEVGVPNEALPALIDELQRVLDGLRERAGKDQS